MEDGRWKMEDGRWKMEDFCELNSKFHQKIREIRKSNKSAVQTRREF